ncbi:helix-turn-helix domain-containing protein [Rhodococcus hoagii]|nr:helix-turn-helix domain-containing protein [Prescottella equi]
MNIRIATLRVRPGTIQRVKIKGGFKSDAALAQALGVSRTTLCRVVKGTAAPSPELAAALFDLADAVSLDTLFEVVRPVAKSVAVTGPAITRASA